MLSLQDLITYSDISQNNDVGILILRELQNIVIKVKRSGRWYQVGELTRAFIRSCSSMKLKTVKSLILMKAIIKTIKELRELISQEAKLIKIGLKEAWKMSELASSWGHSYSRNWRNNKYFIIWQALTLKWISRLFGGLLVNL